MQFSSFEHITLYCFTFLLLYLYDIMYNSKRIDCARATKLGYPTSGSISAYLLLVFGIGLSVLTEGFRYDRGVDQLGVYAPYYIQCNSGFIFSHDFEPLFAWINQTWNRIDPLLTYIPFGSIFIVYSLLEWIMMLIIYKSYRNVSRFFLLFGLISVFGVFENFVRQGLAISMTFAAIGLYNNKRWKWALLIAVASIFVHRGNAVFVAILIAFLFLFKNKPLNIKITIPLFIFFAFFVGLHSVFHIVGSVVSKLNISDDAQFSGYLTNADYIQSEIDLAEEWQRGPITELMTALRYVALFYIGWNLCRRLPKLSYVYNTFVVCSLMFEPFRLYGTLSRAFLGGNLLWFIPLSVSLFYWNRFKDKKVRYSIVYVILFTILLTGKFVFLNPDAKYVCDILIL